MIIFDLDGTLADCEHRRHFVQKPEGLIEWHNSTTGGIHYTKGLSKREEVKWKPNWKAFYEACDQDLPIEPVIHVFLSLWENGADPHIWSGRCESVRQKTFNWLRIHVPGFNNNLIKMRPIGDSTPDDQLKEKWLDEAIAEGKTIDMVFDDREKVVSMWKRRGIFVFDVSQGKGDF
jgi:hypothetical protein